ncbi:S-4TM family putative pore-forming effector [Roseateles sp. So40a]|uniref:S-4TM family putative pore-forming effector n=1 Tax=Roseateles sp. So40a TaxID=3400226 RepID=UPI003A859711
MMNDIGSRQNENRMVALLRARRRLCSRLKVYQGMVVAVTAALPVASWWMAIHQPSLKPYVASLALVFTLCEVVFLDRWLKGQVKTTAKLQEEFDCHVLDLSPNEFLVGTYVDPEDVHHLAAKTFDEVGERQLRDWYPVAVGRVPLHVGRILCQRENLIYDADVRKFYSRLLRLALVAAVVALLWTGMHVPLEDFLLTYVAPAMPAMTWMLREFFRQKDTIETLTRLKGEAEKLWRKTMDGLLPQAAAERSRELQDAIYSHRVTSPLVFDVIYWLNRGSREGAMNAGADARVSDYQLKNTPTSV